MRIKNVLRKIYIRIFPASKRQVTVLAENMSEFWKTTDSEKKAELAALHTKLDSIKNELDSMKEEQLRFAQNLMKCQEETYRYAKENNWGFVFNNAIADSKWIKKQSFSFGRWAIGYPCAYVLFRVLDEIKPRKILELGLGQSTRLLGQYADNEQDVEHLVIESDHRWIDLFKSNDMICRSSEIVPCGWKFCSYKNVKNIRVFEDFDKKIAGRRFDLIMIDAPIGGDMKEFSRIDVLLNLPDCIGESFVIIMDDADRQGERNTWNEMKSKLRNQGILFADGFYRGEKAAGVMVSDDLKYVLTM